MRSTYDPGRFFARLFASELGQHGWTFLNRVGILDKMEAACRRHRPPVEAFAQDLAEVFGLQNLQDPFKRMIGHMVRLILETHGYVLVRRNVHLSRNAVFTRGACYARWSRSPDASNFKMGSN